MIGCRDLLPRALAGSDSETKRPAAYAVLRPEEIRTRDSVGCSIHLELAGVEA